MKPLVKEQVSFSKEKMSSLDKSGDTLQSVDKPKVDSPKVLSTGKDINSKEGLAPVKILKKNTDVDILTDSTITKQELLSSKVVEYLGKFCNDKEITEGSVRVAIYKYILNKCRNSSIKHIKFVKSCLTDTVDTGVAYEIIGDALDAYSQKYKPNERKVYEYLENENFTHTALGLSDSEKYYVRAHLKDIYETHRFGNNIVQCIDAVAIDGVSEGPQFEDYRNMINNLLDRYRSLYDDE